MPPADELVDAASSDARLVPGAAPSRLTTPTTLYRGRSLDVDGNAVDMDEVVPQHAHLPLVVMLLLSQWSVGVLAVSVLFAGAWNETERSVALGFAAVLAAIAALASFTHLGQPLKAWRAVLGWRHSWLSREVIALSLYIALAAFAFALTATGVAEAPLVTVVAAVALAVGLATVGCSVMVYVATGRAWWSVAETTVRFGGTVVVGALAWLVVGSSWWSVLAAFMLAVVGAAKIVIDRRVLAADDADLRRTASLLKGSLAPHARSRVTLHGVGTAAIIVGAVIGDVAASGGPVALSVIVLGTVLLAASEFFERRLFFQACAPSTMPGAHR